MQLLGLALVMLAAAPKMADGGTPLPVEVGAGLGDGVWVKVGDHVKVQLRGRLQVQANFNVPVSDPNAVRTNQIFVRRARLMLRGELPWHLSFQLQLGFAANDMEPDAPNVLRDFYVSWAPLRDLNFRVGQQKVPFDVQRYVSSSSLQFVDRSIVTAELNLDRDVGLVVYSDDVLGLGGKLRYFVGVFGGDGRNRLGTNIGLLYSARVIYSPFGRLDDKVEGDVQGTPTPKLAIGASVARNVMSMRQRSTTGNTYRLGTGFSYTHAGGDVTFRWRGLSLATQVYWRGADLSRDPVTGALTAAHTGLVGNTSVTEYSRSAWGWFAQAGYFITTWLEVAARYGDLRPIGPTDPAFLRQREVGGGLNFMPFKHDLKLQTDCFWIDDGTGRNGRVQIRLQAQIYF